MFISQSNPVKFCLILENQQSLSRHTLQTPRELSLSLCSSLSYFETSICSSDEFQTLSHDNCFGLQNTVSGTCSRRARVSSKKRLIFSFSVFFFLISLMVFIFYYFDLTCIRIHYCWTIVFPLEFTTVQIFYRIPERKEN